MLVERFSRYVYAIAVQAFRLPEHDAEDVFQEVFARVFERLDTLREDDAVRPWIAQLTRRLCIDRLRAGSREVVADTEELPDGPDEDVLAQIEEAFDVHDALAGLPEHCREILDRFFARDESYRAIGEALELPAGTMECSPRLRPPGRARHGSCREPAGSWTESSSAPKRTPSSVGPSSPISKARCGRRASSLRLGHCSTNSAAASSKALALRFA